MSKKGIVLFSSVIEVVKELGCRVFIVEQGESIVYVSKPNRRASVVVKDPLLFKMAQITEVLPLSKTGKLLVLSGITPCRIVSMSILYSKVFLFLFSSYSIFKSLYRRPTRVFFAFS